MGEQFPETYCYSLICRRILPCLRSSRCLRGVHFHPICHIHSHRTALLASSAGSVSTFALLSSSCRTCQRVCCHALAVIPLGPDHFFFLLWRNIFCQVVSRPHLLSCRFSHTRQCRFRPPLLRFNTISTHLFLAGIGYSRTCDTLSGWSGKNKGKKQKNRKMAMKAKYPKKVIIIF